MPHPLRDVHQILHRRVHRLRSRGVRRVHQREQIGEVIRCRARAWTPDPAVPLRALLSGREEILQRAGDDIESRPRVVELKPVLDLVQPAAGIVRIIRLHDVLVRLLVIEINHRARLPVQRDMHVALVVHAQPDLAPDPIRRRFRLGAGVVVEERRHRRLRVQHEILLAQQPVIRRELDFVVAGRRAERPGVRLVQGVERTAAVESLRVVNRAPVPIHERAIHAVICIPFAIGPEGQVRARHPQAIARDAAGSQRLAHAHQTFAERSVAREVTGAIRVINRLNVEGDQGARGLRRDDPGVNPITLNRVGPHAAVTHGCDRVG